MTGQIGIVQIEHPGGTPYEEEAGGSCETGRGARLLAVYGELLGIQHIFIGYHKLVYDDARTPELGFEHAPGNATPDWPNQERPQQAHLDIEVAHLDDATDLAVSNGATLLRRYHDHVVLADPVSHRLVRGAPLRHLAEPDSLGDHLQWR